MMIQIIQFRLKAPQSVKQSYCNSSPSQRTRWMQWTQGQFCVNFIFSFGEAAVDENSTFRFYNLLWVMQQSSQYVACIVIL